jgi:hypothetical protein
MLVIKLNTIIREYEYSHLSIQSFTARPKIEGEIGDEELLGVALCQEELLGIAGPVSRGIPTYLMIDFKKKKIVRIVQKL